MPDIAEEDGAREIVEEQQIAAAAYMQDGLGKHLVPMRDNMLQFLYAVVLEHTLGIDIDTKGIVWLE